MSKAVLISIRPKWCEKIASGDKTIEVRKTRPKLDTPFKCYIYCSGGKDKLWVRDTAWRERWMNGPVASLFDAKDCCGANLGNGCVIGEFTCDRIYELETKARGGSYYVKGEDWLTACEVAQQSCLSLKDMHDYLHAQTGYGWHITDLRIYGVPRELREFWFPPEKYCVKEPCGDCPHDQVADIRCDYDSDCQWRRPLRRAPQSWCYVEELP